MTHTFKITIFYSYQRFFVFQSNIFLQQDSLDWLGVADESVDVRAARLEELVKSISIEHNILSAKLEKADNIYSRGTQTAIEVRRLHFMSYREPGYDWEEFERLNRIADDKNLDRKRAQNRYLSRGVQSFLKARIEPIVNGYDLPLCTDG